MSCRYKNECPSYSGWCEAPKQTFERCLPFLVTAIENARKERDAALKDLFGDCNSCAMFNECKNYPCHCINGSSWIWRCPLEEK